VPVKTIVGRVVAVIWPAKDATIIHRIDVVKNH
jgi:hypothetical protein